MADLSVAEKVINSLIDHAPTIVVFLAGGITFVLSLRSKLDRLGQNQEYVLARLENVEVEIKKQTEILATQYAHEARLNAQDARMNQIDANHSALRQDIRDLRFGRGFILEGPSPHS